MDPIDTTQGAGQTWSPPKNTNYKAYQAATQGGSIPRNYNTEQLKQYKAALAKRRQGGQEWEAVQKDPTSEKTHLTEKAFEKRKGSYATPEQVVKSFATNVNRNIARRHDLGSINPGHDLADNLKSEIDPVNLRDIKNHAGKELVEARIGEEEAA